MNLQELLDWAFQRHLNPLSWYIRPLFLLCLCYFAYLRNWKGIILTFLVMTSSMVWFPAPHVINPQMQEVLEFEKQMLGSPVSAILTLGLMFGLLAIILYAFWRRSLMTALIILNGLILGKLLLAVIFTGEAGLGTLPVTFFGLLLVNIAGYLIYRLRVRQLEKND